MNRATAALLALLICSTLAARIAASDPSEVARATVVKGLKHNEGLIDSLYVEYDKTVEWTQLERAGPTDPADRHAFPGLVYRTRVAANQGATVKLWRKGAKQRNEESALPSASPAGPFRTATFDGFIVRELFKSPGAPLWGRIATAQRSSWLGSSMDDPVEFVFRYYETPLSAVIDNSVNFAARELRGDSGPTQEVSFQCGDRYLGDSMRIVMDTSRNIPLEREVMYGLKADADPWPNQKVLFQDYKAYPATADGKVIWFPSHIVYLLYNGRRPNGELLPARREDYVLRTVQPNVEMPDSLFELTFPPGVPVDEHSPWIERTVAGTALETLIVQAKGLCGEWGPVTALALVLISLVGVLFWRRRTPANG